MRKYSLRFIGMVFVLALCFSFSFSNLSRADACLPSCSSTDTRFLTFGGQDLDTFVFDTLSFGIGSPVGATTFQFGVFDGESGNLWDGGTNGGPLIFTLIADPLGDASGTFEVGTWTSDGVGGINNGIPMPDNAWFNAIVENVPEAQAASGNYLYLMVVTNVDTSGQDVNNFKFRVADGNTLFMFPSDQPFGYEASFRAETQPEFFMIRDLIYPNIDVGSPGCIPPTFCDFTDPACCLFGTTYDGVFDFYFLNNNPDRTFIDFWDGDYDFGPLQPDEGPPFIDTDDPNTPPGIPVFTDAPNTNPQGSAGSIPPDDQPILTIFRRAPNINYELIDPNGVVYPYVNPSATNEWELFQLNTEEGCAPDICDIQVPNIPVGLWRLRVFGMDFANINFIRAFDRLLGVDDDNNPVPPLDPDLPPSVVPTFSEWGMVAVVLFLGIIGLYHLRRKKNADASSS